MIQLLFTVHSELGATGKLSTVDGGYREFSPPTYKAEALQNSLTGNYPEGEDYPEVEIILL